LARTVLSNDRVVETNVNIILTCLKELKIPVLVHGLITLLFLWYSVTDNVENKDEWDREKTYRWVITHVVNSGALEGATIALQKGKEGWVNGPFRLSLDGFRRETWFAYCWLFKLEDLVGTYPTQLLSSGILDAILAIFEVFDPLWRHQDRLWGWGYQAPYEGWINLKSSGPHQFSTAEGSRTDGDSRDCRH
jgi:hypothetical protein